MNEEDELKIFTKILSFVNEYKTVFAEDPILKYYKLLKKYIPYRSTNRT